MVIGAHGSRGRPLAIGAQGGSWAIEGPAGEARVLERCEPSSAWAVPAGADAAAADGDALLLFFETRALDRRLATKIGAGTGLGRGHVVGVRELGADEEGGYAVRDRYTFSLGELIRSGTSPAEHVLHEVVAGLLGALGAIETYGARPHGGLDPDAVLVADVRPRQLRVGVRGVVPERLLGRDLEAVRRDELRRVGLLVHHLVTGRPFKELGGYPIRPGGAWDALGKNGPFWLGLVNELLDPKAARLGLGDVKKRVDGLRYRPPRKRHGRTVGIAAAAAVVVAGAAAAFVLMGGRGGAPLPEFERTTFDQWTRLSPVVQELQESLEELGSDELEADLRALLADERVGLFDPVARGKLEEVSGRGKIESLGRDEMDLPFLREIVREVMYPASGEAPSDDQERAIQELARVAPDAIEKARLIVAEFGLEQWEALGTLSASADAFDARGWTRAAELVRTDIDAAGEAVETLRALLGITDGETAATDAGAAPGPAEIDAVIGDLAADVSTVERRATEARGTGGRVAWDAASLDRLEQEAAALSDLADLPGDGVYGEWLIERHGALPERDPVLASLPALVGSAGRLGDGDTLDTLTTRLAELRRALDAAGGVAAEGWTARVDLVALRDRVAWYGSAQAMPAASGSSDAGGEAFALWAGRVEEWAEAAADAVGEADGARGGRITEIRNTARGIADEWAPVLAEPEEQWRPVAARLAGVDEYTDQVEQVLSGVRWVADRSEAAPNWESVGGTVNTMLGRAENELSRIRTVVDGVRAIVLKTPQENIDDWRGADPLRIAGSDAGWLGPLVELRRGAGEAVIGRWEDWRSSAGAGLGEDERRASDEARRLGRGLAAIDAVLSRDRVPAWIDESVDAVHLDGGFSNDAVLPLVRAAMVEAVAADLGAVGAGWEEDDADRPGGVLDATARGSIERVEGSVAALNRDLALLGEVTDGLLGLGLPGEEGVPPASDIASLLGRLETEHAPLLAPRPGSVTVQIERSDPGQAAALAAWVLEATGEPDPVASLSRLTDDTSPAVVRYASAVRLGELGEGGAWPTSVESMAGDAALLAEGLSGLGSRLGSGSERDARIDRLRGIVFAWWARGFHRARTEGDIGRLLAFGSDHFGSLGAEWGGMLDTGGLEGAASYNAAAYVARERMVSEIARIKRASAGAGRQRSIQLGNELAGTVRGEIGTIRGMAQDAGATGWLDRLEDALRENEGGASWEPSEHGPGRALGWAGRLIDDADPARVVYTSGGEDPVELGFSLLQAGGTQVFLAEEEVSVGVFDAMVQVAKGQQPWTGGDGPHGVVKDWLSQRGRSGATPVAEPIGYTIQYIPRARRVRVLPSQAWFDPGANAGIGRGENQSPAYPDGLLAASDNADANRIVEAQQPTASHPMTMIPFDVATAAAQLMGGRLPDRAEYGAALATVPVEQAGLWNLSDRTVQEQRAYVAQVIAQNRPALYAPGASGYASSGNDAEIWGSDDGVLWFRPVGEQSGGVRYRNIVGNVAEWTGGARGVIGASALSRPGQSPRDAATPSANIPAFVDVGFRLAIPADEYGSLASALEKVLESTRSSAYALGGG